MNFTLASLFSVLALAMVGCSAEPVDTTEPAADQNQDLVGPPLGSAPPVTYSRDLRPVDGALTSITIQKHAGKYDATRTVSYVDRFTGKEVTETRDLFSGGTCKFEVSGAAHCSRDLRPVDGALTELDLVASGSTLEGGAKTFDATLTTTIMSPLNPSGEPRVESIGEGLERLVAMP